MLFILSCQSLHCPSLPYAKLVCLRSPSLPFPFKLCHKISPTPGFMLIFMDTIEGDYRDGDTHSQKLEKARLDAGHFKLSVFSYTDHSRILRKTNDIQNPDNSITAQVCSYCTQNHPEDGFHFWNLTVKK